MAWKINNKASGTWSTAADWDSISNTPTLHATTNITMVEGTPWGTAHYSLAFTAPNTTNYSTGCLIHSPTISSGTRSVRLTLQEYNAGTTTWGDTSATCTILDNVTNSGWLNFRWTTPYQYTTTAGAYYRIKAESGGGTSGSHVLAADSGGSNFAYLATDDRTGVPATTDDVFITGINGVTPWTMTVDGTQTIGSGALITPTLRSLQMAVYVAQDGILSMDTVATCELDCKGILFVPSGGEFRAGTTTSPIPYANTATLKFTSPTTSGDWSLYVGSGNSKITIVGSGPTSGLWKTNYVSGTGTSGSPLVISGVPKTITAIDDDGAGTINVTAVAHGFATGQDITISGTTSFNETDVAITVDDDDTFHYTSALTGAAETSGTATLYPKWAVNEQVVIGASSDNATNYQECETKFIKTRVNSFTYTLSDTLGGAETAGLTYTHNTNAWVWMTTRNVMTTSGDTSKGYTMIIASSSNTGNKIDWFRADYIGSARSSYTVPFAQSGANSKLDMDHFVISNLITGSTNDVSFAPTGSKSVVTIDDSIVLNCNVVGNYGWYLAGPLTANNIFAVNCYRSGIVVVSSRVFVNNGYCISCNINNSTTYVPFVISTGLASIYTDCEIQCSRYSAIRFSQTADDGKFVRLKCGNKGKNSVSSAVGDIYITVGVAPICVFEDCTFADDYFVISANYLAASDGTSIGIHNKNATTNKHFWITNYGIAQATGVGLDDTNIRTAGTLNFRFAPEQTLDADGNPQANSIIWSSYILCRELSAVYINGFIQLNAAFIADTDSTCVVNLYLPGSTTPDSTQNLSKSDTNFNVFTLAGNYTGTVPAFGKFEIVVTSKDSGAYAYLADLFNGTNRLTNLTTWLDGKPSPFMFEQIGDAAAVWSVPTSNLTVGGSVGEMAVGMDKMTKLIPGCL